MKKKIKNIYTVFGFILLLNKLFFSDKKKFQIKLFMKIVTQVYYVFFYH